MERERLLGWTCQPCMGEHESWLISSHQISQNLSSGLSNVHIISDHWLAVDYQKRRGAWDLFPSHIGNEKKITSFLCSFTLLKTKILSQMFCSELSLMGEDISGEHMNQHFHIQTCLLPHAVESLGQKVRGFTTRQWQKCDSRWLFSSGSSTRNFCSFLFTQCEERHSSRSESSTGRVQWIQPSGFPGGDWALGGRLAADREREEHTNPLLPLEMGTCSSLP